MLSKAGIREASSGSVRIPALNPAGGRSIGENEGRQPRLEGLLV